MLEITRFSQHKDSHVSKLNRTVHFVIGQSILFAPKKKVSLKQRLVLRFHTCQWKQNYSAGWFGITSDGQVTKSNLTSIIFDLERNYDGTETTTSRQKYYCATCEKQLLIYGKASFKENIPLSEPEFLEGFQNAEKQMYALMDLIDTSYLVEEELEAQGKESNHVFDMNLERDTISQQGVTHSVKHN